MYERKIKIVKTVFFHKHKNHFERTTKSA